MPEKKLRDDAQGKIHKFCSILFVVLKIKKNMLRQNGPTTFVRMQFVRINVCANNTERFFEVDKLCNLKGKRVFLTCSKCSSTFK